jgi:hypothetical protein
MFRNRYASYNYRQNYIRYPRNKLLNIKDNERNLEINSKYITLYNEL